MKIKGDGFLSELGQKEAHQIVACNDRVFYSLECTISNLRSFASSREVHEQDTEEGRQKIIALVLTVRILEIAEAALLIMKSGMSNEADTLFRVLLDAYFVFGNVCSDASFVTIYFKSDDVTRLTLINAVKNHKSELFKGINEYASETMADELKKKIKDEESQKFDSYAYANKIDCSHIYHSMYRITCASLHTSPRSLGKYVDEDAMGNIQLIKDHPDVGDIPQRAFDFAFFLIKVLSGLKEVFGCLDETEIQNMVANLNEVTKNEI